MKHLFLFALLLPALGARAEPLKVCDVLKHLNQYEGRQVEMRGAFVLGERGSWLLQPEKNCRAPHPVFLLRPSEPVLTALRSRSGKRKTTGVFTGTIAGWEAPRKRGKKAPVFAATSVSGIRGR